MKILHVYLQMTKLIKTYNKIGKKPMKYLKRMETNSGFKI